MKMNLILATAVVCAVGAWGCAEQPTPEDPDAKLPPAMEVFAVQTPPTKIEAVSPQDAAWVPCLPWGKDKISPNFITQYIYKINKVECGIRVAPPSPPIEGQHNHSYSDSPPEPWIPTDWTKGTHNPTTDILLQFSCRDNVLVKQNDTDTRNTFKKIAAQNNDTTYNGTQWDNEGCYSYIPAKRLDIECVEGGAYDAEHPQGASLNDIAVVRYYSAHSFIQGAYRNPRLGDVLCPDPIVGVPVEQFNRTGANLIQDLHFDFVLTCCPEREGVYTFKITYTDASGASYSDTTPPVRLAGRS